MATVEQAVERVMDEVHRVTDPKVMSRGDYGQFLEAILSRLEGYKDAYDDEERDD